MEGTDRFYIRSDISLFYTLPGTPSEGLKPPKLEHVRVFIQSTSYGSRCLKAGETLLYKVLSEHGEYNRIGDCILHCRSKMSSSEQNIKEITTQIQTVNSITSMIHVCTWCNNTVQLV